MGRAIRPNMTATSASPTRTRVDSPGGAMGIPSQSGKPARPGPVREAAACYATTPITGRPISGRTRGRRDPSDRSDRHRLHNLGEFLSRAGEAVEVVFPLAPGFDDAPVPQESEVVADGRLALAELLAERANVPLAVG